MIYYEFHSIIEITRCQKSQSLVERHFNRFCSNLNLPKLKILASLYIKCKNSIQVKLLRSFFEYFDFLNPFLVDEGNDDVIEYFLKRVNRKKDELKVCFLIFPQDDVVDEFWRQKLFEHFCHQFLRCHIDIVLRKRLQKKHFFKMIY